MMLINNYLIKLYLSLMGLLWSGVTELKMGLKIMHFKRG